jgi:hypothetical protein
MPIPTERANAAKSAISAKREHVFAHQKNRFGLFIRTIGITRADAKLTLANLAHSFDRLSSMRRARARHKSARNTPNPLVGHRRTSNAAPNTAGMLNSRDNAGLITRFLRASSSDNPLTK